MMDISERGSQCLPPPQYQRISGHHWLEVRGYDGSIYGLVVLQWNPGSRTWTHSDCHDTHGGQKGIDANYHRWVAFIEPPPIGA